MLLCPIASADDRVDDVMYQDPAFPATTTRAEFSPELKPLWLQALNRPESELQRMAADTIALAHRSGMPGLEDTSDKLIAIVQQANLEPTVRYAAARALVTLDARHADKVFGQAMESGSLEMAMIVEPALARWSYAPAREIWRKRLDDPATERTRLLLAISCLGTVKDAEASTALLALVSDVNTRLPSRLAAARAAANINDATLLDTAVALAASVKEQPNASWLATTLLDSQTSSKAVEILKSMATHDSPVVAGMVLRRLFEIDPTLVYGFSENSLNSNDVNIRRVGCEALVHQADAAAVSILGPALNDPDPGLRVHVSQSLIQLAQEDSLREDVVNAAMKVFALDSWRGLEQSIIVLGTLDHEPAGPRMLKLLDNQRPEVAIAAAWGLRKLAIAETLPELFDQAEKRTKLFRGNPDDYDNRLVLDAQLSQLFQTFGEMDYRDPEPLMRTFIPKKSDGPVAVRPAAIWAIGKLHDGKLDEPLAKLLARRLSDVSPSNPELFTVRRMSAIALGRMKAESQLNILREFVAEAPAFPGQACAWSLRQITGEVHEFSLERSIHSTEWFLRPR